MGQCMSRKAAGAFAASAAVSHNNRPDKMQRRQQLRSPDDDNNKPRHHQPLTHDTNKRHQAVPAHDTATALTRGVAMSFGFKQQQRRPTTAPAIASNASAARRLANATNDVFDRNGNDVDNDALTPTGRSTPRLVPPKKEANATRVSRFGFRQAQGSRQNKIADLNCQADAVNQNRNNNVQKKPISISSRSIVSTDNNNPIRSRMMKVEPKPPAQQITRYTLQSTQLPRPEPIRVIETKTAKTLANNNKRVAGMYKQQPEETSSKDGSLTEDSGVGSHYSGCLGETEILRTLEQSPTFGVRRRNNKPRNLEVVVTAKNTFDVKDLDDSNDSCDSMTAPPLPQLPSAFYSSPDNRNKNSYQTTGLVRERTLEYQRYLDRDKRVRNVSKTSSSEGGLSDDCYGEEEKTCRDAFRSEKSFMKPMSSSSSHPTFLKSRINQLKEDSSPPSSDDPDWGYGGEAMADDVSFSLSSSDESKDKNHQDDSLPISTVVIGSAIQSLMSGSLSKSFTTSASKEVKNVMLTIEDPKFAAVAAASNQASLLDDETLLSPSDSISYSESEEIKRKLELSSSNSKDINEKLTPPSPGTPTNASNSLSISDGKDDFLIDDEIADQPGLLLEDTISMPHHENSSETIMESTPKPKRKVPMGFEGSPLSARSKRFSQNRTGSLDTLSPCESIASDDLMMDFYSQSSGLDECEGQSSGYPSMNETLIKKTETDDSCRGAKDWNCLLEIGADKQKKRTPPRSRLLSARACTPSSPSCLDSPKSLDGRCTTKIGRPSAASSPIRHSRISDLSLAAATSAGYDSDDSIRLDRANHKAIKQDIVSIKTMLLKLRRVLNETVEEELMRSDTHNPFENQHLTNGIFNSPCLSDNNDSVPGEDNDAKARFEVSELRRQVLFLQGQLEDREKTVQSLQEQMIKLSEDNYHANSAPASTMSYDSQTCNAATQTERIRPISAGPSLLNGSSLDGSAGSLVSVNEHSPSRKSRPFYQAEPSTRRVTPSRLWRQPGEPPSPQRYAVNSSSSISRRAHHSRSRRTPPAASTTS